MSNLTVGTCYIYTGGDINLEDGSQIDTRDVLHLKLVRHDTKPPAALFQIENNPHRGKLVAFSLEELEGHLYELVVVQRISMAKKK